MKYIGILILVMVCSTVMAVDTQFYNFKGPGGFAGPVKAEGIGIHSKGHVILVPKVNKLHNPPESVIWSLLQSGTTLYAGAGETGRILYFDADGSKGNLADLGKICVKALAADKDGILYAGGPDGIIYRFPDRTLKEEFCVTGEKYVWSLLFDGDVCYAGTGPRGKVIRIAADGSSKVLFDGDEKHIMGLVLADGQLYAGTAGRGLIYRINPADGKGGVFAELAGAEVGAMFVRDKSLWAITGAGAAAPVKPPVKVVKGPVKVMPKPAPPPSSGKSSIFRVSLEDAKVSTFFTSPRGNILSLCPLPDGRIAAGTDAGGLLYLVKARDDYLSVPLPDVGKIMVLASTADGFLAGTEKKAFIGQARINGAMTGEYISRICPVPEVEAWGVAALDAKIPAGSTAAYSIRTGKSKNTKENWSDWVLIKDGDLTKLNTNCTYFQLKLDLTSEKETPRITELALSYLPVNLSPEILKLSVGKPPTPRKPMPAKPGQPVRPPAPSKNVPAGPMVPVMWQVVDKNGDSLELKLEARFEDETKWIVLAEELKGTAYNLDTRFLPDGAYTLKLTASDEKVNRENKGFAVEKIMDIPLVIDKTGPLVSEVAAAPTGNTAVITGKVSDKLSKIKAGHYRINGEDWEVLRAGDFMYDEQQEEFRLTLKEDEAAAGDIVTLRFTDAKGNYTLARVVID